MSPSLPSGSSSTWPGSRSPVKRPPCSRTVSLYLTVLAALVGAAGAGRSQEPPADLILHGGKVVTVDARFSLRNAVAVRDGKVVRVGRDAEVLALRGPQTRVVGLQGRTVLPGLIDSHTHPTGACMTEADHPIPTMERVPDVLRYLRLRAAVVPKGDWIQIRQVFITRLNEQRYPTRAELDTAAPEHPVVFSTGPDASLNTLAMKLSGIDRNFKVTDGGPGFAERDPATGEPTGILRSCTRFVKIRSSGRSAPAGEQDRRLRELFQDYNANGITSICDRDASPGGLDLYRRLDERGELTVRVSASHHVDTLGPIEQIQNKIREVARHPLRREHPRLKIIGIKTYLDGGMLTGSAYMQKPWGVSKIYGITDPQYRGVLFVPADRLTPMVRTAVEEGLQFTAHSVGDGAVQALLNAYEEVNRTRPVRDSRPTITHANFQSAEDIARAARLGVGMDIQPIWLREDAHTLVAQFGYDRLRYFQPLRSLFRAGAVVGGGSDHMQKIGALRAINSYHPFLGMWTAITRKSRKYERPLHPEEALSREEAIR
ncbi:MAG: amidohydrolase, partial [Armatimonadetes bacterium]|nr:amidohydrolase [Armatimonadota bacterium]